MTDAPTPRETADHAELARRAEAAIDAGDPFMSLGDVADWGEFHAAANPATVLTLLSEIAALRGERDRLAEELHNEIMVCAGKSCDADVAERQRDELRKAAETAANLFKLCTEPTMFENASTLNVYAQMTEWLVRNRPILANQGADQ